MNRFYEYITLKFHIQSCKQLLHYHYQRVFNPNPRLRWKKWRNFSTTSFRECELRAQHIFYHMNKHVQPANEHRSSGSTGGQRHLRVWKVVTLIVSVDLWEPNFPPNLLKSVIYFLHITGHSSKRHILWFSRHVWQDIPNLGFVPSTYLTR